MKLKAIIYNLRQLPVITTVSIIGTALAIFLIMVIVMMQQVNVLDISPEVNRHRTLYTKYICMTNKAKESQYSGSLSINAIYELYEGMEHVESIGIYSSQDLVEAMVPGQPPMMCVNKSANAGFFDINKYDFISGAPFTEADVESNRKVALISESVARQLFGTPDAAGREMLIGRFPYRVAGVFKDVNPIASTAYAEIIWPIPSRTTGMAVKDDGSPDIFGQYMGDYEALILADDAASMAAIKAATASRYATLNSKLDEYDWAVSYFGSPFTIEEAGLEKYSNVAPDIEGAKRIRLGLFAILLIVPAINLSSITQNRLRQRVAEIGLKRAFGCTRVRIMGEMFIENLMLTAIGALIGLILSIGAAWLWADFLFGNKYVYGQIAYKGYAAFEPLSMLSLSTFGWAIFFCLALNILSCGIPTFMASRVNPAVAVNGHLR